MLKRHVPASRCFALLLCAVAAAGQTVSRPPRASASKKNAASPQIAPTLLMVDAAADDSAGKPIRDLTAADFALSLNGEPRTIASVRYVDAQNGSVSPVSGVMLSPDQIHRTLVLIADDLGLTASESANLHGAITRFLDEHLRSSDLISILRTSAGEGALQALTNDRRKLDSAIRAIRYNPAKGGEEASAAGARGTIRMAFSGLDDLEGRKAVVLFTGNRALVAKAAPDAMVNSAHNASAVFSLIDVRAESASPVCRRAGPGRDGHTNGRPLRSPRHGPRECSGVGAAGSGRLLFGRLRIRRSAHRSLHRQTPPAAPDPDHHSRRRATARAQRNGEDLELPPRCR